MTILFFRCVAVCGVGVCFRHCCQCSFLHDAAGEGFLLCVSGLRVRRCGRGVFSAGVRWGVVGLMTQSRSFGVKGEGQECNPRGE